MSSADAAGVTYIAVGIVIPIVVIVIIILAVIFGRKSVAGN